LSILFTFLELTSRHCYIFRSWQRHATHCK